MITLPPSLEILTGTPSALAKSCSRLACHRGASHQQCIALESTSPVHACDPLPLVVVGRPVQCRGGRLDRVVVMQPFHAGSLASYAKVSRATPVENNTDRI
jgi:hypothetical protein